MGHFDASAKHIDISLRLFEVLDRKNPQKYASINTLAELAELKGNFDETERIY